LKNPPALEALIESLRCLPGVGPKSAQRMAYYLLQRDRNGANELAHALQNALEVVDHCKLCNTFSEHAICPLCASENRNPALLCVVEMPTDLLMLENTQSYSGLYFVLMGKLSPLDGVGPKEIHLEKLMKRAQDGVVEEVILATNYTVEGDATAHYISTLLQSRGIKTSRIARGMPMGGEIEFVDSGTLAQAMMERRSIK
jgi:recombination protein RecR